MRRSFDERPETVDNALIGLIQSGIDRYKLQVLPPSQIEDEKVDELMDLASDILGDRSRNGMLQLPKEKKIQLILQLTVHDVDQTNRAYLPNKDTGKKPTYYVDLLNSAISNQPTGIKSQLVDFARQIAGATRSQMTLKDIIQDLKVQCQCQTVTYVMFM
jgi:hypothetical protein